MGSGYSTPVATELPTGTELPVASTENPPPGSDSFLYVQKIGEPEVKHGPANAWHYMGSEGDTMTAFGHVKPWRQEFIAYCVAELPDVGDQGIKVNNTGYWDKMTDIPSPLYGKCKDETGRWMIFINDTLLCQRYLRADTLIRHPTADWEHDVDFSEDDVPTMKALIKAWKLESQASPLSSD